MSNDLLPHIFEPFYTTKPAGKGPGLGLATVYGIAKQHAGWAEVQSQLGQGSTFRVFIPVPEARIDEKPATPSPAESKGGNERILVAEDEEPVRDFVVEVLKSCGYEVRWAETGPQALEQWTSRSQEFDLLLTDMVMPGGLSGRELAQRLLAEAPALKVIYTSGYSPGLAGNDLALLEGRNFLAKPYRPAKLLQMVRRCLDRKPLAEAELELAPA